MVTTELCFIYHPEMEQGDLSKLKSQFIRTESESEYGRKLGLDEYISVGVSFQGPVSKADRVLEDVFESFIGAVYLDQGLDFCYKFVRGIFENDIKTGEVIPDINPKNELQEAMGDVVTLVEKAKEQIDEKDAEKQAKKMMDGDFTLDDMLKQMKMVQKIGSLGAIAKMIPGMPTLTDEQKSAAEKQMKDFETIINSMTPYERRHPDVLKFSQKNRIAKGAGKTNADVNRVLKKYDQAKEQMKMLKQYQKSGKMPGGFGGGFGA